MIATEHLSVAYHGRMVLKEVTIRATPGQVLALVGPSGCGKSSLLATFNALTDLIPGAEVRGDIRFDGCLLKEAFASVVQLRRSVGMIFQKPNPFAMSIRKNITMPLREHGVRDRQELHQRVEAVLRDVGLWDEVRDRLDRSALDLSGGQQQRLCIARALALRPQVLLMDEPCSSLDPISTERIESLIRTLTPQITVVIVTHNLAQARRISDQIAVFWIQDGVGQVIEQGATAEVFAAPKNPTAAAFLTGRAG